MSENIITGTPGHVDLSRNWFDRIAAVTPTPYESAYSEYIETGSSRLKQVYDAAELKSRENIDRDIEKSEYSWKGDYEAFNKQVKKPTKRSKDSKFVRKQSYSLEECLNTFKNLFEKDFGEIYLSGSVALRLQNKISRNEFKDLDIVVFGGYQLDDDIQDYRKQNMYPRNENLGECKSVIFNNMPIDLFKCDKSKIDFVEVEYNGDVFLCQDYKGIIKAKIEMVLPSMKDSKELYGNCFELSFK